MKIHNKTFKNKKILITGGLGFMGSSAAVRLASLGAQVTVIDTFLPTHGANLFNLNPYLDKIEVHITDTRDRSAIDQLVLGKDYILHYAAHASNLESTQNPSLSIDLNCYGTLVLLEAVRKYNPSTRFIFAASRAQYGKVDNLPANEKTPMNPLAFYGLSKVITEHYTRLFQTICGLPFTSLRFTNTYGPRHQMKNKNYSVYNYLLRQIIDNETVQIFGQGEQKRDLLYIDDSTNACILAMANPKAIGKIYNVSSGKGIKLIDFVKTSIKCAGSGSFKNVPFPTNWQPFETGDYYGTYKLINKDLGWKPKTSLSKGLKKTINFYKKYKINYWQ